MKRVNSESSFNKDYKTLFKKHYDTNKLDKVIQMLQREERLPGRYKDHALKGTYKGYRECHIESNWLLLYKATSDQIILVATGTHDDLFGK